MIDGIGCDMTLSGGKHPKARPCGHGRRDAIP
jgi:hypothetical protein